MFEINYRHLRKSFEIPRNVSNKSIWKYKQMLISTHESKPFWNKYWKTQAMQYLVRYRIAKREI